MANRILIPPHEFDANALFNQPRPGPGYIFEKIFFQCELKEITKESNVEFGIIAYPAWKKANPRARWRPGKKVEGHKTMPADPSDPTQSFPINSGTTTNPRYTAFGNNEILSEFPAHEKSDDAKQKNEPNEKFLALLKKIKSSEDLMKKYPVGLSVRISENPHPEYDVTITDGSTSETYSSNPCPPYEPGE